MNFETETFVPAASGSASPASFESSPTSHFWWRQLTLPESRGRRLSLAGLTLALVMLIGLADFLLGFELSLHVFYIMPVCLAVASLGVRFGVFTAIACAASELIGDAAAGAHFIEPFVPWLNALFAVGTYLTVVWLLHSLVKFQLEMEDRVRQRTAALQNVLLERDRLEKAILEVGERERRIIGHDLHDGLGQHLTGTALAGEVLGEKLRARKLDEEERDLWRIVGLIEEGIEKTRRIAKGLLLVEIQPDALTMALRELAGDVVSQARIKCDFTATGSIEITNQGTATHLFRIASEAVRNALRHGKARRITMSLREEAGQVTLEITDDGTGLPPPETRKQGLGLSIMAHRAEIIGWYFSIGSGKNGGTIAVCRSPIVHSHHARK